MPRRLIAVCAACALIMTSCAQAIAQGFGSSGFGNSGYRGGMGSSGFGSSSFGSGMGGGFGSSGFGSSGFGGSGFGGGFGSSGFGGTGFGGFGSSGFGGGAGNSMFGNSGFGGGYGNNGYGGGQNFVGRDAADMQAVWGQMGRAGTQFFSQMNRNMNRSNRRQTTKTIQNPPQPMRVAVRVAFDPPRPTPDQLATSIQKRLASILVDRPTLRPAVYMEGDTAVIRGVAASENERDVIGQLLAMEPGVRNVRNEMTVAAPASAEVVAPPPGS